MVIKLFKTLLEDGVIVPLIRCELNLLVNLVETVAIQSVNLSANVNRLLGFWKKSSKFL